MTKNEILKRLHMGNDALEQTQSQTAQSLFAKKVIKEAIKFIEERK